MKPNCLKVTIAASSRGGIQTAKFPETPFCDNHDAKDHSAGRLIVGQPEAIQITVTDGSSWHTSDSLRKGTVIMPKRSPVLRVLWTILAAVSSLPVLFNTVGSAAWNGVNFVVCLYLIASVAGTVGLFAGFWSAFSQRRLLEWITCVSALAIVVLSAIYAAGFIFERTPGIPLNDPMYFGRFHAPILMLYCVAFLFCVFEALLYFPRDRTLRVP